MSVRTKRKMNFQQKMTRTTLPIQQSISNAIRFFCDSVGVFSKQDFAGSSKHIKKDLLHCVESFSMIAWGACYHEHCMAKFRNKFQENHVKDVQKSFEAIAVAECMSFIEDSLQSND